MLKDETAVISDGFLKYLKAKKKLHLLPWIIRSLSNYQSGQTQLALVKSAVPLSKSEESQIENLLKAKFSFSEISFEQDSTLIGGLKLVLGDQVLDLSTKEKLQTLTNTL